MPQPRSRSWAVRLLGLTYGIFCVIVLSSYTANLAAFLTVQQLGTTIDSPLSLLRNGGNFAVSSGGSTLSYFRSALDPVAAALAPRMRVYSSTDAAVNAVRSNQVVAFLTDAATLQYFAQSLPCDVTISGQPFGPNSLTFGLPKNSSLLTTLNRALLEVESNGVLDQLIRKWTTEIDQCAASAEVDTNRLDVRSLVGLFYMLLLAMALAMAIAGIERFFAAHPKLWQRLRRPFTPVAVAGQRLASRASNIIPEDMRRVPDHGFSKSALEISRSFRPRGRSLGGPAFAARAAAAANAVAAADAAACNGRNTSSSDVNSSFRATSSSSTPDNTVHNVGIVVRNDVEDIDAAATLAI